MDYEVLKLDNQICFSLYSASKSIISLYKPFLKDLGLTYTQYITMLVLWENTPLSIKEIGNRLDLDTGTLTPLLKKLETMDLIRRIRDENDERIVNISLTKKGEALKIKAVDIPEKIFIASGVSIEDAMELKRVLDKISKK